MGLFGPNKNERDMHKATEEQETIRHQADLDNSRFQRNLEHQEHEAELNFQAEQNEADRQSAERVANTNLEIEMTRQETENRKNDAALRKAQIEKGRDIEVAEINAEKARVHEEHDTKRAEINAETERIVSENAKQVQIRELEAKEKVAAEVSKMFDSYLNFLSDNTRQKIELLEKNEEVRKAKYIATLESTREEQSHILELSKEAKGQDKLEYLDKLDELESTINSLIKKDEEDSKMFKEELEFIDYKAQKELQNSMNNNMRLMSSGNVSLLDGDK